ncbi:MAG: thiamine diphosphokinase [Peptostreptococcaceae bacterium]|nr:thiamine diphosphokinase [Peptostreptococcaceae bacterium]
MLNKCYILTSYFQNQSADFFKSIRESDGLLICADGGQDIAKKWNLIPSLIIGDFDSSENSDIKNIRYPKEKDVTDTEACIIYALQESYTDITLLGGLGGRVDHTLGNLALLAKYHVVMIDNQNIVKCLKNETINVNANGYKYISVISFGNANAIVTLKGVKFPLKDYELPFDSTLGISNEITSSTAEITIQGTALIIQSKDL